VKWDSLNTSAGVPFTNEAAFDTFQNVTLIPRTQSHFNRFCKRDFDLPSAIGRHFCRDDSGVNAVLIYLSLGGHI
jgi:hypothetical protein